MATGTVEIHVQNLEVLNTPRNLCNPAKNLKVIACILCCIYTLNCYQDRIEHDSVSKYASARLAGLIINIINPYVISNTIWLHENCLHPLALGEYQLVMLELQPKIVWFSSSS